MNKLALTLLSVLCIGFASHSIAQQKTPIKMSPYFIITDTAGNKMEVVDLKVRILQGSDISLTTECDVMSGQAEITVDLNNVAGFRNFWKERKVKFFFPDGETLLATLPKGVEYNELRGFAMVAGNKVPYKLAVSKLESAFRKGFTPQEKK